MKFNKKNILFIAVAAFAIFIFLSREEIRAGYEEGKKAYCGNTCE